MYRLNDSVRYFWREISNYCIDCNPMYPQKLVLFFGLFCLAYSYPTNDGKLQQDACHRKCTEYYSGGMLASCKEGCGKATSTDTDKTCPSRVSGLGMGSLDGCVFMVGLLKGK